MRRSPLRRHVFLTGGSDLARALGMSLLLTVVLCGTAQGQQMRVSGRVTTIEGLPLSGVTVGVRQTRIRTTTDAAGSYAIAAPATGTLAFSVIGYRPLAVGVDQRNTIDVAMVPAVAALDELVVTGYTDQRRADITGAVAGVDVRALDAQTGASVLQRLGGRVPGVTVEASGSPASRSTVRIWGVTSFQNNDPLYIIDGTPVEDTYLNWLSPKDIQSIQVLKDASAASLYGARAENGVVVIETRKAAVAAAGTGGPVFSLDVRTGVAQPARGYDDVLITNSLDYFQVVKRSYENGGFPVPENIYGDPSHPTVPAYIWPNDGVHQTTSVDTSTYAYPDSLIMVGSPGTDWWKAVFGKGFVGEASLALSGAGAAYGYSVSFNYLNQEGTAAYNRFQRAAVRVNTQFGLGRLTLGENLAVVSNRRVGGMGDPGAYAEDGIMGKNVLMQPVVPVYDIAGNFAAGKAVGLGSEANPLKAAWAGKDTPATLHKFFGNAFAGYRFTDALQLTSRFGVNLDRQSSVAWDPMSPELSAPSLACWLGEAHNMFKEWTWTNTLRYANTRGGRHGLDVLVGQEANRYSGRYTSSGIASLTPNVNGCALDSLRAIEDQNQSIGGGRASLLSFFGRLGYDFADRYYLNATLRGDRSSRLGPGGGWGAFPALSVGWRLSQEPFFPRGRFFTNVMLRFGYGVTGNRTIPAGLMVDPFGGDYYYSLGGAATITPASWQTSLADSSLKAERNTTVNAGLDLEFVRGAANLVVDVYRRKTTNILFAVPGGPGTAPPLLGDLGEMENKGIDISLTYAGTIGAGSWNVTLSGSHYRNKILEIDGVSELFYGPVSTRYGNQVINKVGYPIGSFYGLIADGFFEDSAAVANHAMQYGAAPGRIRFRDVNGDGVITADDRTIIGSPHPDFTAGLDLTLQIGAFDVGASVFGSFGNDIWDAQKEFYVFRNFSANVRKDLLTESWEPGKTDAKYPRLDASDTYSGQALSSFYVENGSYVRLRALQVGVRLPHWIMPNMRVYVLAENLLTITGYSGLDPSLPAAEIYGPTGDIRDQYRGVDRGAYPTSKVVSLGISTTF